MFDTARAIVRLLLFFFFFSSRRRHTRLQGDWSSDVCSSDLRRPEPPVVKPAGAVAGPPKTPKSPPELLGPALVRFTCALPPILAAMGVAVGVTRIDLCGAPQNETVGLPLTLNAVAAIRGRTPNGGGRGLGTQ